ncbi:unnamed protein product [Didymodactylos carnosus]|uniref:Uncharacterized protein n=1 Tax=Didymodactylos carnosus TaxID=1234261 RepID=A0A814JF39_9BILA|nr:unnamed protein product [Didymodactylos carnosus]CAF1402533.1 unnamed protein product [Didymodactylos carnosus]CAF3807266.1 unnamed protein product [Didymodactylos carnosus]CAF4209291.1 unnamed protein product [Didymodactylos carnosus]
MRPSREVPNLRGSHEGRTQETTAALDGTVKVKVKDKVKHSPLQATTSTTTTVNPIANLSPISKKPNEDAAMTPDINSIKLKGQVRLRIKPIF